MSLFTAMSTFDAEAKKTTVKSEIKKKVESSSDTVDSDSDYENQFKSKQKKFEKKDSLAPASPPSPPPPPSEEIIRKIAKNKQCRELDLLTKNMNHKDESFEVIGNDAVEDEELITARVMTKNGVKKWEMKKNEQFKKVFEDIAKFENTQMGNIVLMLREKILNFSDTPSTVGLQIGEIIDCGKTAKPVQERIKIVDSSDDEDTLIKGNSNLVVIMLQGEEGRKSRVKFLIAKDETFGSILKKYCEKRELDPNGFMMEFDGDKVELKQTPEDLEIESGEIFDVTKSKRPTSEKIKQNEKNYEFDDELICL